MKNKFLSHFISSTFLMASILFLGSCKNNPTDRLVDPNQNNGVTQTGAPYYVYQDEILTAGGLSFIPSGENQSIDLVDQSLPRRSLAQLRYTWNGLPVAAQQLFAGFILSNAVDGSVPSAGIGRDLSAAGYTKMIFSLKGALSQHCKLRVEGPDDGPGGNTAVIFELQASQVGNDWAQFQFDIPPSHFSNIKAFVTVSLQYQQPGRTTNPGNGGVVYFDDIRYER